MADYPVVMRCRVGGAGLNLWSWMGGVPCLVPGQHDYPQDYAYVSSLCGYEFEQEPLKIGFADRGSLARLAPGSLET
jgi:hypothetical protein